MTWQRVVLSFEDVASGRHFALQEQFEAIFIACAAPMGAAMFGDLDSAKNFTYYFSPIASSIAAPLLAKTGGVECPAPKRSPV
jgi:hypothetical protein